jgi:hypothetical protein
MISHEYVAEPWPVFVRHVERTPAGYLRAIGHGLVVARRMLRGVAISYDVRMDDGRIRSFTLDHFWNPENVAARMVGPSPVGIPAPPAYGARACP